ncbi:MAG: hypothetical protein EPO57_03770 [Chitinophagaceae bacterium]|nr:MAG: hypothetical protein EPO57_03770 [Chitinophagaceae bacterium]
MKKLLGGLLLIQSCSLFSQQFGGNPPSLQWKKIDTDTARIIFPVGLDSQANRIASVVHFLAAQNASLGSRLRKVNFLLQNQTTVANGYAGLGPYRSEFFMTPSMNNFELGSLNWIDALAVHEYRHVQQYNNFRQGAADAAYHFFGEDGLSLAVNAAVPDWFFEGDAVYNETVQTQQGRGRIPFFTNQYKALWEGNKKYSWMKLRNGSLKDYVPSHYPLGFLLLHYGNEKYGTDFWKKVTGDAVNFKGVVYPFQNAIKRYAGVSFQQFRENAFSYFQKSDSSKSNLQLQPTEHSFSNFTYYTDYFFPFQLEQDSMLYLKSSYRNRPQFFIKDKTGEHFLCEKDISLDEYFSFRNGKIVYAAYQPDIRWGWRNFSNLKIIDIQTGVQKTITHKAKYFSPDISNSGNKIVAVQYDANGKCELHILDANNGAILKRIADTSISLFTDPKFIDENFVVAAIRNHDGRMALVKVKIEDGSVVPLIPLSYNVLGFLSVDKNKIYFTASYSGNDELYAMDLSSQKIYQLTNTSLGNYFVSAKKNSITFSGFNANGYQLRQSLLTDLLWKEINPSQLSNSTNNNLIRGINGNATHKLTEISHRDFVSKTYRKTTNFFNFHSWRPNYEDPELTFSLYGENVLNTFQSDLYYLYNQNDRTNAVGFNAVYGALFPFLSAGTQLTLNKKSDSLRWNQLDSRVGFSIPLNFTSGRFFRYLNFGSNYFLRNEFYKSTTSSTINFSYLSHFITYSQQLQKTKQDIFPKKGIAVSLHRTQALTRYSAYQFIGSASVMLPGVVNNHHLILNGSFQQRDTLNPGLFSNRFSYSRGFTKYYFSRMWRVSSNYHFPLWLPDWGVGNIVYISRIRANAFYDYTKLYSRNKLQTINQRSAGGEIYFDTKWWNQHPLTFGIRFSYLLDNDLSTGMKGRKIELILPLNIIPK